MAIPRQAWFPLRFHALQDKLFRTKCKHPVVVAGRGSGKTEVARRFTVCNLPVIKPWPDPKYAYCLPTYKQAKRVVLGQFESLIPKHWLVKDGLNRSELTFKTVFGSELFIVGMDSPSRFEGIQIDGFILDECSDIKPGTFGRTLLPMLTHRNGYGWRIGVPKRTGPGAPEFREAYEKGVKGDPEIESYTWASDSVLSPEQLAKITALLDAKDYKEQIGGVWVESDGAVFYAFSEHANMSERAMYQPSLPIGVGSDFNVNPMAWVLFHVINGEMYVFDEIYMKDTNTQKTLNELHRRYDNHQYGWVFFGDASSKARKTSSDQTDFLIIMNDHRFTNKINGMPQQMRYPRANPSVAGRFAATNAMLCNAQGRTRLLIHPKCKKLREDLEQRTYKEGTRVLPADEKMVGHITDALGYPIDKLFPIRYDVDDCGNVYAKEAAYAI